MNSKNHTILVYSIFPNIRDIEHISHEEKDIIYLNFQPFFQYMFEETFFQFELIGAVINHINRIR